MTTPTFEVSGKQMLSLMQAKNAMLHRWDLGFFCMTPQPTEYVFGDAPQEPWIGTLMFQQMVSSGVVLSDGTFVASNEVTATPTPSF